MNCIPGSGHSHAVERPIVRNLVKRLSLLLFAANALLLTNSCSATERPPEPSSKKYQLEYRTIPEPKSNLVRMQLTLSQPRSLLREMSMRAPATFFRDFAGDGEITVTDDQVVWLPPATGGKLTWTVTLNRLKSEHQYDAYMTRDWALLRASDIIPPATTRTVKNASGNTSLTFSLPAGWSAITQYRGRSQRFAVRNPERRFDRPTGWILLGDIGTRVDRIAGISVTVSAPKHQGVRRMDILAFLAWNLPEVARLFPGFPSRLTVVSANEPMWRGGLSAPSSLFIHASLPLLSENGTSTLLHELMHIGIGNNAGHNADWIVEGMAEYYSLKLLHRSGTISERRFEKSLAALETWGREAADLCVRNASGAVTAMSSTLMHSLDIEIRTTTAEKFNLDDVINALANLDHKITLADLTDIAARLLGGPSAILDHAALASCAREN